MHMATQLTRWTLAELHRLPDDGNKYELVRGELFVTPPPTDAHETVLARLTRILDPFVAANDLGMVYHPRAVIRFEARTVRGVRPGGHAQSVAKDRSVPLGHVHPDHSFT